MFSDEGAEEEPLFNMNEIVSDEADDAFFPFPSEAFFFAERLHAQYYETKGERLYRVDKTS